MGDVTILVDIDSVLARPNYPKLLAQYNRILQLSIPSEQLEDLSMEAFHELPQVRVHRECVGEERFSWQIEAIQWHPRYVVDAALIDGALFGVKYLAKKADDLGYCTARFINFNKQWNRELAASTQLWLKQQDFPHYSQVLFCDGLKAKMDTITERLREQPEVHIILIDDRIEKLLQAFYELSECDQELLTDRLTLVAFGYYEVEVHHPLQIIPFPDWREVVNLSVEREFSYAKKKREE